MIVVIIWVVGWIDHQFWVTTLKVLTDEFPTLGSYHKELGYVIENGFLMIHSH